MKFRIIETPKDDKENEGKTLTLKEVALFTDLDERTIYERGFMADVFMFKGYKFEISEHETV